MVHVEIHWCATARDAARLEHAGLPRLDIEPSECSACHARVGEVNGQGETVTWKPCGVVLSEDRIGVLCKRCFAPVDKALGNR